MSREYIELGPTPAEEACEQLGPNYDRAKAQREHRAYIFQLTRQFGIPPDGCRFGIKSFPHDFGTYSEVVIFYDAHVPGAMAFALKVDEELPNTWDDLARAMLGLTKE